MSSLSEASVRTLGDVGKMGGLEAVALGLTDVVFEAENKKNHETFVLVSFPRNFQTDQSAVKFLFMF